MAGPLSFAQEEALRSLHRGWPFGIDARTARGLVLRGLATLHDVHVGDGAVLHNLPRLTGEGAKVASRLAAQQEAAAGLRRFRNGAGIWGVIEGGRV